MKIFLNTINDDGRTVENYRPVDELVGILSTNISKTNDGCNTDKDIGDNDKNKNTF